ncbi:GNAT family N-acetyltransferase [Oceanirhabdus sp. W0125-5]|uniref:GNAT family N-acetyltransferase n=1 Tax=Oceanirhabdus sp. W0125-5 TaxID=2999116 RepID=UPI0022F2C736|nr:GNAT family protein [Oceanirhabdus sp. W0125-5]WBW94717.1 GNAT family protein [Oceanirhabdus sp. W0125-5]
MKNKFLNSNEEYELITLRESHLQPLFSWNLEEKDFEKYTCRPLRIPQSFEEYTNKTLKAISEENQKIYILIKNKEYNNPLGKIALFDFNPRNHSAEFGYYIPSSNRGQGLGVIMLSLFIQEIFTDDKLNLNKIYATTSSNNIPSIKILEKFSFTLDGRLREHYWIKEEKYDQLNYSILKREWKE